MKEEMERGGKVFIIKAFLSCTLWSLAAARHFSLPGSSQPLTIDHRCPSIRSIAAISDAVGETDSANVMEPNLPLCSLQLVP